MNTKPCKLCHKIFPLDGFYKHSATNDGYLNQCKECTRARVASRYKRLMLDPSFRDAERKRCRERAVRRGYAKKYKEQNLEKYKKITLIANTEWRRRNKEKRVAHDRVAKAIKSGRLRKSPCEVCGSIESETHHPDYSRPLEVVWLCSKHHKDLHNRLRSEKLLGK